MEYLIIALFVAAYLGIGIGVTKMVFVLNEFTYYPHNINDSLAATGLVIMWPVFAVIYGTAWLFNNLFKRIL